MLLTLLAAAQTALLQGMRRIGDLGRVTVLSALAGTIVGLSSVWIWGQAGLVWFVAAQPFSAIVIAVHYIRRQPSSAPDTPSASEI